MRRTTSTFELVAAGSLALLLGACNAISGLDELEFDLEEPTGNGGSTTSTALGGSGGAGGGVGGMGTGGETCVPPCEPPLGGCYELDAACVDGKCVFTPVAQNTPCEDGDACTEGDTCDGEGSCVSGPSCPSDNPCVDRTCDAGSCVDAQLGDGTSCGAAAADRCCDGACVDISIDTVHCGGCGRSCEVGEGCQSAADTSSCDPHPAETTGRCTCAGTADCPSGQICRTQSPYAGVCTPETDADCAPGSMYLEVFDCPNYCLY
ncbi:MAG: hypothetical protein HOW73_45735 [Polyangiaceae bacterium]|nr:hypothetical protein [Polyangiaceae bacterium]